jgi:diguanylate cyclase (GGDEF)-like protein
MSTLAQPPWARLADLLFGDDPRMRIRVRLCFIVALLYLSWAGMIAVGLRHELLISHEAGHLLIVLDTVVPVVIYALVRSGVTAHWADPAMVLPQMITAYVLCAYSYVIAPDSRGSILQLMCLIQIFGLMSLTQHQVRIIGATAIASVTMAWIGGTLWAPIWAFDVYQEAIHLSLGAFILTLLTMLSHKHSGMRTTVRTQKKTLLEAVAQVEHIVTHDSLTGLFNRRHMVEVITREAARVERSGMSMALVLIDLDHFKRVNDTYGHQVGDQVLQAFAQAAQSALRETDIIGRWGGEEFVVLLPDTFPADRAMIAVERIQAILADAQLCPGVPSLRVSFSAGVAVPRTGESLDAMLERADRALYAAKEQGRRRAIVAP